MIEIMPFGRTGHDSTRVIFGAAALGIALALSGSASGDPLDLGTDSGGETIVVGSQG